MKMEKGGTFTTERMSRDWKILIDEQLIAIFQ